MEDKPVESWQRAAEGSVYNKVLWDPKKQGLQTKSIYFCQTLGGLTNIN